jgi:hypothetical protein
MLRATRQSELLLAAGACGLRPGGAAAAGLAKWAAHADAIRSAEQDRFSSRLRLPLLSCATVARTVVTWHQGRRDARTALKAYGTAPDADVAPVAPVGPGSRSGGPGNPPRPRIAPVPAPHHHTRRDRDLRFNAR